MDSKQSRAWQSLAEPAQSLSLQNHLCHEQVLSLHLCENTIESVELLHPQTFSAQRPARPAQRHGLAPSADLPRWSPGIARFGDTKPTKVVSGLMPFFSAGRYAKRHRNRGSSPPSRPFHKEASPSSKKGACTPKNDAFGRTCSAGAAETRHTASRSCSYLVTSSGWSWNRILRCGPEPEGTQVFGLGAFC